MDLAILPEDDRRYARTLRTMTESNPTASRAKMGWFVVGIVAIGLVWGWLLPAISQWTSVQQRVEMIRQSGINPSAVFYSDHPSIREIELRTQQHRRTGDRTLVSKRGRLPSLSRVSRRQRRLFSDACSVAVRRHGARTSIESVWRDSRKSDDGLSSL
jgi:hypothetical protein